MNEELLNALNVIKEECKKYDHCKGCPFKDARDDCGVQEHAPENWLLEKREVYF